MAMRRRGSVTLNFMAIAVGVTSLFALEALAQEESEAAEIVAAQVRSQGYSCPEPVQASRDAERSRPEEPVWLLQCADAQYRVRLIPDQGAEITRID